MKINIETIPHEDHRYETVGDYWIDKQGVIQVRVSEFGTEQEQFAVALHELVEMMLCRQRGITFEDIDEFDTLYERQRSPGDESEPGDAPDAPYRQEHQFATNIERQFIHEAGINWAEYNERVNSL